MRTHVQRTVSRCFAVLRQLRQIRRSVPTATFQMLVVALMRSRLDYGNGVLAGIPAYLMCRFQSVLNASARLIFNLKRSDYISDALISLHWLRVPERIQYKVSVLTYKVPCGTAPRYPGQLTRVADVPGRRSLRSVEISVWSCRPSTFNRWQLSSPGCRLADLERAARRRDIGIDFAVIPAATEDSPVQTRKKRVHIKTVQIVFLLLR